MSEWKRARRTSTSASASTLGEAMDSGPKEAGGMCHVVLLSAGNNVQFAEMYIQSLLHGLVRCYRLCLYIHTEEGANVKRAAACT